MSKPLLIGITGGIGSGKTIVSQIFNTLNVPIFYADDAAKKIINTDKEVIEAIKNVFGNVYHKNELDRKKLAKKVFNNPEALQQLNNIIHPQVKIAFENFITQHAAKKMLLKEAAILFETEGYKELDKTILVVAPEELRVKRVMSRDGVEELAVRSRMKNQLPDSEKMQLADFIITNNDSELLIPQVLAVMKELMG